jgi:chromosomal replication initiator protein
MWKSDYNRANMNIDYEQLWRQVCGDLGVSLSGPTLSTYISTCFVNSITPMNDGRLIVEVGVPTSFHGKTIDERYYGQIKKVLEKVLERECELALKVLPRKNTAISKDNGVSDGLFASDRTAAEDTAGLNRRFTFDNFVVGSSNNLAYAAAKAVVDSPGSRHNPLFVWGGVGVGKTHLMQAIGHGLAERGISKVTYLPSEKFTNDLINSFRNKTTDSFKKKYRQVGALLIDDIQFFAGKETSQEEFFHTFNDLYMAGVQIVMTSDRKPQEIAQVEQRLISRFLGGLTVDVGLPDYEMRVAILRKKATELSVETAPEIIDLIASNVMTNGRELEGLFVRLANAASVEGRPIDNEMVEKIVGVRKAEEKRNVRPVMVIGTVAKKFNYRNKDLTGKCRKAELVKARHIAMFLLNKDLKLTLVQVGNLLGGRDHTTVMHGVDSIKRSFDLNQKVREQVMQIRTELYRN